jgi:hypothetical protein
VVGCDSFLPAPYYFELVKYKHELLGFVTKARRLAHEGPSAFCLHRDRDCIYQCSSHLSTYVLLIHSQVRAFHEIPLLSPVPVQSAKPLWSSLDLRLYLWLLSRPRRLNLKNSGE